MSFVVLASCARTSEVVHPSLATDASPTRSCGTVELTTGLEVVVLGSGGGRAKGRAASSYLISIDGIPRYLVDAGPGAFASLGESGLPSEKLDTILLTHLHVDHAGDLAGFIKSRVLVGKEPIRLRIVGPSGHGSYPSTSVFVDRLFGPQGAFAYLPSFRSPLQLDTEDVEFDLERAPTLVLDEDGVKITAASVDHRDVPTIAYRIERAGRSIVISGDLASRRGQISTLAHGADVLVYDAAVLEPPASPSQLYELHTPPSRIGEVASAAGAGKLILGHIPPDVEGQRTQVLATVRSAFAGEVAFAHDCLVIRAR